MYAETIIDFANVLLPWMRPACARIIIGEVLMLLTAFRVHAASNLNLV